MYDIATDSRHFWRYWSLTFCLSSLLVILISLPPFVAPGWNVLIMQPFSAFCHQIAERSPMIAGIPFAVCHRCYGIFVGLVLGTILFLALPAWNRFLSRYSLLILLASLFPLSIDWLLGITGLWQNTATSRLITGSFFGIVVGLYFVQSLTHLQSNTGTSEPVVSYTPDESSST